VPVRDKIAKRVSRAGLGAASPLLDGLEGYFQLLRKWNRKVSLTSLPVEDAGDEAIDRLLVEPLLASRFLPNPDAAVMDIGSGGGSPAVPMKLAASGISLRMVESKTRKAAFLREVIRHLALSDTVVDAVRFEALLARPELNEAVDVVTMRAVKVEAKTLAGLQFFLRPGGLLFLFGADSRVVVESVCPQLTPAGTHALLKQWGSRLEILRKEST
jgi:16S rRNA (guanine527-N7)-methyltransferase